MFLRYAALFGFIATAFAQDAAFGVDKSVSPCTNFYRYACGVWLKNNPIPSDQSRWARWDQLQERNNATLHAILDKAMPDDPKRSTEDRQIGDFYASCMDEKAIDAKGIAPIAEHLKRIAALPTKLAITEELVRLNRAGVHPLFNFDSEPDAKDSSMVIGGLDQGGLSLPDRDYYLKTDAESEALRKKFVAHVEKMFQLAGEPAGRGQTILRLETDLAKGSLDLVSRRDPNKTYHKYTLAQLISLSPGIDWQAFFNGLGLGSMTTLDVSIPPFIRAVESVIVQNSLDDLKVYLSWHLLHESAPMLSRSFSEENFAFYGRTLGGAKEQRARWKRCVTWVDRELGDAVGRKFVDQTFGTEGKERTLAMVKAIEGSMEKDIQAVDWMSPETKSQALVKLHAIVNKIGYPDKWKDYSAAKIARDDALGNVIRLNEWHSQHELAKIGKPVDRAEWQMSPPTVNAYYSAQMNDINFPAGILQPPFYSNKADDAVNFGAIGSVIGHELTHGFDDEGRQFDAKGNLQDWWKPEDAKGFEERAECVSKEYSEFTGVGDLKVNGALTLGENTADNGGVRLALMSLLARPRKGKHLDQRFFTGYAQVWCENASEEALRLQVQTDPHSPPEYRVNGVLKNMPEFQKAFSCKPTDPMVSGKACRVW